MKLDKAQVQFLQAIDHLGMEAHAQSIRERLHAVTGVDWGFRNLCIILGLSSSVGLVTANLNSIRSNVKCFILTDEGKERIKDTTT